MGRKSAIEATEIIGTKSPSKSGFLFMARKMRPEGDVPHGSMDIEVTVVRNSLDRRLSV